MPSTNQGTFVAMSLNVAVRLKPADCSQTKQDPGPLRVDSSGKYAELTDLTEKFPKTFSYSFDAIFDQEATDQDVFKSLAVPIVTSALNGHGGNFLCYGPSGSGKTHTFEGVVNLVASFLLGKQSRDDGKVEIGMSCLDMSDNIYDMLRSFHSLVFPFLSPSLTLLCFPEY